MTKEQFERARAIHARLRDIDGRIDSLDSFRLGMQGSATKDGFVQLGADHYSVSAFFPVDVVIDLVNAEIRRLREERVDLLNEFEEL